jgi:photosystem II stability/assembly factor-like uncharacterized protein
MRRANAGLAKKLLRAAGPLLLSSTLAAPALADPPPRVVRMVWAPDGRNLVLVTNRGLIFADEQTKRFRLMCHDALDLRVDDVPSVAFAGDGRLLAAGTAGLKVSSDGGCSWQGVAPFGELQTPSLAQHPTEPDTLYLATFGEGQSALRVTRDGGRTFSDLLPLADTEFVHSLLVAPGNPRRIYAAGIAFDASTMTHSVLRSSDGGATWERFTVELDPMQEERASLVTVNPSNENELLVRTTAYNPEATPERLLLSRDGGATFARIFLGTSLKDASYGAAGDLWVADQVALWRSTDGLASFTRHGDTRWMSCVNEHGGRLWGCGQFAAGKDGIGVASKAEDPFFPWMDFRDVSEQVACSASAPTLAACATTWEHWKSEVLGGVDSGPPTDAGFAGYGGADAGATGRGGSSGGNVQGGEDSGGCAVGSVRRGSVAGVAVLLLGLVAAACFRVKR